MVIIIQNRDKGFINDVNKKMKAPPSVAGLLSLRYKGEIT